MELLDQICLVRAYREFKGNLKGYTSIHEYRSMTEALPKWLAGEKLNTTKFKAFSDDELKELFESLSVF